MPTRWNFFVINGYLLEYISFFDFITDAWITYELMNSRNTLWASITVCAMAAPHLVASFQMIHFLHHKVIARDKNSSNKILLFVSWISITPLFMVFMILMDFFMILNSTLVEPVAYGLKHFCNVTFLTYGIEQFYLTFFQMTSAEMSGIRHMRTITQLTFETVL